ncbi:hypothetical protein H5410_045191 [Solanum commersonii]|uniref:Uncharacterized protein n=1 Tax=Solanum commersonii TaxID=4109 RepID=A0A9J5XAZ5_SOLCO|nr:hypothetical protein H5410_045191 [Solanum commersonii]
MDSGIIPVMLLFATEKKEEKPTDFPISSGMEFLERLLSLPMRSRGTIPLKKLEESERTLSLPISNVDLGIDPFRKCSLQITRGEGQGSHVREIGKIFRYCGREFVLVKTDDREKLNIRK